MMRHVAIPVCRAFPDAHGLQMGRLQRSHMPLVDGIVGDAVEAHITVAPSLDAGPFDALIKVAGLASRKVIDIPGRSSGAARVDTYADIPVRHPFLGIDHFPILISVG